jgi:hypothetical protein
MFKDISHHEVTLNASVMNVSFVTSKLGRPSYSWQDNIQMDLKETRWNNVDWIDFADGGGQ